MLVCLQGDLDYGAVLSDNEQVHSCHSVSDDVAEALHFDIDGELRRYWKTLTQTICTQLQFRSCKEISR